MSALSTTEWHWGDWSQCIRLCFNSQFNIFPIVEFMISLGRNHSSRAAHTTYPGWRWFASGKSERGWVTPGVVATQAGMLTLSAWQFASHSNALYRLLWSFSLSQLYSVHLISHTNERSKPRAFVSDSWCKHSPIICFVRLSSAVVSCVAMVLIEGNAVCVSHAWYLLVRT